MPKSIKNSEEAALICQFNYRRHLLNKKIAKIKSKNYQTEEINDNPISFKLSLNLKRNFYNFDTKTNKIVNFLHLIIFYLDKIDDFNSFRLTNKSFFVALSNNFILEIILKNCKPYILKDLNTDFIEESLFDSITSYTQYLLKQESLIMFLKVKGNEFYNLKKPKEALEVYERTEKFITDIRMLFDFELIVKQKLPIVFKTRIFKLFMTIYSNSCMCYLTLGNAVNSLRKCRRALKYHRQIVQQNKYSDEIIEDLKSIHVKLLMRLKSAKISIMEVHLVRFSPDEFSNLGLGSIIKASHSLRGSVFERSIILIVKFERGIGCEGIILNKKIFNYTTRRFHQIGGPCLPSRSYLVHNVQNINGAVKIREGLYFGGNVENHVVCQNEKVMKIYGISSWFDGQLDGELFNADWTLINDMSNHDILNQSLITSGI